MHRRANCRSPRAGSTALVSGQVKTCRVRKVRLLAGGEELHKAGSKTKLAGYPTTINPSTAQDKAGKLRVSWRECGVEGMTSKYGPKAGMEKSVTRTIKQRLQQVSRSNGKAVSLAAYWVHGEGYLAQRGVNQPVFTANPHNYLCGCV